MKTDINWIEFQSHKARLKRKWRREKAKDDHGFQSHKARLKRCSVACLMATTTIVSIPQGSIKTVLRWPDVVTL